MANKSKRVSKIHLFGSLRARQKSVSNTVLAVFQPLAASSGNNKKKSFLYNAVLAIIQPSASNDLMGQVIWLFLVCFVDDSSLVSRAVMKLLSVVFAVYDGAPHRHHNKRETTIAATTAIPPATPAIPTATTAKPYENEKLRYYNIYIYTDKPNK